MIEMEEDRPVYVEAEDHGKPQSSKEAQQEQDFNVIDSNVSFPNLKIKSSVHFQRSSSHEPAAFCVSIIDLARKVVFKEEKTDWEEVTCCRVEQKFHTANSQTLVAKKAIAARRDRTTCHLALVLLCVLGFLLTSVEAVKLQSTGQILSENCLNMMEEHHNDCPNKAVSFEKNRWIELNKTCCDKYTGIFHCQHIEEGRRIYGMAACLPEETVPAGKRGKLVVNGTGYPKLDLGMDCPDNTFRDHSMNSSFILQPSCERKTKAEPEEEKWCDGGPSADDLIICRIGYYAKNCPHGHNSHDTCICLQCGEGSVPYRTVTGSCSENNISVMYKCTSRSSALDVSATTPHHQSSDSVSGEWGIKGISPATSTDHTSTSAPPSSDTSAIIGGLGTGLFVLIVIVGLCIIYRKHRRCGSYKIPLKSVFDKVGVVFERV